VTVAWSETLNGTARAVGSTVTIPTSLNNPNTTLIFGEVSYNYNPTFGVVLTGPLTLTDKIYTSPRISATVARTA